MSRVFLAILKIRHVAFSELPSVREFITSQIRLTGFSRPCRNVSLVSENDVLQSSQIIIFLEPFEIVLYKRNQCPLSYIYGFLIYPFFVNADFGAQIYNFFSPKKYTLRPF